MLQVFVVGLGEQQLNFAGCLHALKMLDGLSVLSLQIQEICVIKVNVLRFFRCWFFTEQAILQILQVVCPDARYDVAELGFSVVWRRR